MLDTSSCQYLHLNQRLYELYIYLDTLKRRKKKNPGQLQEKEQATLREWIALPAPARTGCIWKHCDPITATLSP